MGKLEQVAHSYLHKAFQLEKNGKKDEALKNYKIAANMIKKALELEPDHPLKNVYLEYLDHINNKIKLLQSDMMPEPIGGEEEEIELQSKPKVKWEDVVGLEEAKRAIEEAIIFPTKRPDLFPLGWPRGILLFGPPGCGKTMLAAAIASEIDGEFIYVDAATIMSKWLGEAEKNVAKIFKKAREIAKEGRPVVIFIDEVDSLLGTYSNEVGGEVRARNQFLKEMDGLQDKGERYFVYVIAATNKPWKLDEGFIRRFEKRIYIPLPDEEARRRLIEKTLARLNHNGIDVEELVRLTEGYSSADIVAILRDAHMITVRELFKETGGIGDPRPITMEDVKAALKRRKPSVKPETVKMYEEWAKKHGAY
ncbi:ATPase AAA [Ignicoccus islandicus DSM 13165]|uniref:ATPase AAA n=1 Tax=Ignicoccus islandicus DSM 13165 TaxID=940295 RepID=A0A0U2M956_9CREN|nr:AAA family ATPase [Ignicoccus islandicus]ALU11485.1 ATPase AAA [Ignicoccus islandicus DSM 13165]